MASINQYTLEITEDDIQGLAIMRSICSDLIVKDYAQKLRLIPSNSSINYSYLTDAFKLSENFWRQIDMIAKGKA